MSDVWRREQVLVAVDREASRIAEERFGCAISQLSVQQVNAVRREASLVLLGRLMRDLGLVRFRRVAGRVPPDEGTGDALLREGARVREKSSGRLGKVWRASPGIVAVEWDDGTETGISAYALEVMPTPARPEVKLESVIGSGEQRSSLYEWLRRLSLGGVGPVEEGSPREEDRSEASPERSYGPWAPWGLVSRGDKIVVKGPNDEVAREGVVQSVDTKGGVVETIYVRSEGVSGFPGFPVEWCSPAGERRCPDGGKCHHSCGETNDGNCWRVGACGPLTGVFPNEDWPIDVKVANVVEWREIPDLAAAWERISEHERREAAARREVTRLRVALERLRAVPSMRTEEGALHVAEVSTIAQRALDAHREAGGYETWA